MNETETSTPSSDPSIDWPASFAAVPAADPDTAQTATAQTATQFSDAQDNDAPYGRKLDGTPKAKPGRKTPYVRAASTDDLTSVSAPTRRASKPVPPVDYAGMGAACASTFFIVGTVALGPDFAPEAAEVPPVCEAFESYLRAKGIEHIDPTYMLVITLSAYVLKRAEKPTVREKITRAWTWTRSKFTGLVKR